MSIKIEVGKMYELNDGTVHECTRQRDEDPISVNPHGYGPFILDGMCYHQDGRFGAEDSSYVISVKREWTDEPEGKTLAELDVKPGDVVECVDRDTKFEVYRIEGDTVAGKTTYSNNRVNFEDRWALSGIARWTTISRASDLKETAVQPVSPATPPADKPKTWGEMSDAEKGALLLSEYNNGSFSLQFRGDEGEAWGEKGLYEGFCDEFVYRIKPTPKLETVTVDYGTYCGVPWWGICAFANSDPTHRITFTTTDGKPATGTFTNENGDVITLEGVE